MSKHLTYLVLIIALLLFFKNAMSQSLRLGVPSGHTGRIDRLCISKTNKYTITGSEEDRSVRVWETFTGKLIFTIQLKSKPEHVEFHPSGNYFLISASDSVMLFSNLNGEMIFNIGAGDHAVFSKDGKYILANQPFAQYDLTGKLIKQLLPGNTEAISQSEDGGLVAVHVKNYNWNDNDTVFIYDTREYKLLRSFTDKMKSAYSDDDCGKYVFSPDGSAIYYITEPDATLTVRDISTGRLLLSDRHTYNVSASFHRSGRFIAVADGDQVKNYDLRTGKLVRILPSKAISGSTTVDRVQYSKNGKYLLVQSLDSVRIWENASGKHVRSFPESDMDVMSDNEEIMVSHMKDFTWAAVLNLDNGRLQCYLENRAGSAKLIHYEGKNGPLITSVKNNVVRMWDPVTGKLLNTLTGHTDYVKGEQFSPNGKYIVTVPWGGQDADDYFARVWDAETSKLLYTIYADKERYERPTDYYDYRFSPDNKYLFLVTRRQFNESTDGLEVFDVKTGERLYGKYVKYPFSANLSISNNGAAFLFGGSSDSVGIYETATGKCIEMIHSGHGNISYASFHLSDSLIVLQDSSHIQARHRGSNKILYRVQGLSKYYDNKGWFSKDGRYFATLAGKEIWITDLANGKVVQSWRLNSGLHDLKWSNSGKYIITKGDEEKIMLWDVTKGLVVKQLSTWGDFSGNDEYMEARENGNPVIIDLATGSKTATIYAVDEEYVIALSSGYYQSTPGASKHLFYVKGNESIGFEQLDIKYNRPDIVLNDLANVFGAADTVVIKQYYKAYLKRLQKQNIDPSSFESKNEESLPVASIINENILPAVTKDKKLDLNIHAVTKTDGFSRLNVWINEVPILATGGVDISHHGIGTYDTTISVVLTQGSNNIEMSVSNSAGMESYRKPLLIDYYPDIWAKPRFYFIGVGVNHYRDSSRNLNFAAKDIRDLAAEFRKQYPDTYIDTFINENATLDNILAVKERLLQTNEEDIVIFSFSGHGLLDSALNFYCATHDLDFNDPSKKGLAYETLENLLVGIPARKKLLMLDACNSGEADSELQQQNESTGEENAPAEKGAKGLTIRSKKRVTNSYDIMRQMFANITQRNGLVVISAAGAKEYAFELTGLDNGVFTYCFKKGFFEGEADINKSYGVTVTELKNYISKQVEILTDGRQKPTTRKDNLVSDWSMSGFARGIISSVKANALFDSANRYVSLGKKVQAIQLYENVLRQLEAESNYMNYDYPYVCSSIASLYKETGDTTAALAYYFKGAEILEQFNAFSDDHQQILQNIGLTYLQKREYDSSISFYLLRLPILEKMYQQNSREYAYGLNATGNALTWKDQWDSAAACYRRAWEILVYLGKYNPRELRSENKTNYVNIVRNLAIAYNNLDDFSSEAEVREELVRWGGREKKDMFEWAKTLEKAGDIDKADSVYKETVWEIGSIADTAEAFELLEVLDLRGRMNIKNKRFKEALPVYEQIIGLLEKYAKLSINHAFYLNELAYVNEKLGNLQAAESGYESSVRTYRDLVNEDNKNYQIVIKNLESIRKKLQNTDGKR